jgi:predicted dehydrogenase
MKAKGNSKVTRRRFLKGTATAALGAPYVLTSAALGAAGRAGAGDRITVACIGVRNKGGGHLETLLGNGAVQVVAVCDVDAGVRQRAVNRAVGAYARRAAGGTFQGVAGVEDFRDVCARDDVDAVVVATPDHTHAVISAAAMRAGKDVYVEKPMTLTIREGRVLADVARRHGRVVQVGSQRRSSRRHCFACELVRNGRIGKLLRVETQVPVRPAQPMPWSPEPVPKGFHYDLWLGPAPPQPYTRNRCHYNFRFVRDYSGGEMTNFGAHYFDIAQWGIGADAGGPVEVQGEGQSWPNGLWNTFHHVRVEWTYADGVKMVCTSGAGGTRFIGTDGWIDADGRIAEPPCVLQSRIGPGEIQLHHVAASHMTNWLECIRTRQDPSASVEVGHRSATVCHLGNIAMTLGRRLRWDPVREEFPGDDEANRLAWRPYRSPWTL